MQWRAADTCTGRRSPLRPNRAARTVARRRGTRSIRRRRQPISDDRLAEPVAYGVSEISLAGFIDTTITNNRPLRLLKQSQQGSGAEPN